MKVRLPVWRETSLFAPVESQEKLEAIVELCSPQRGCTHANIEVGDAVYIVQIRDLIQLGYAASLCRPPFDCSLAIVDDDR